MKHSFVDICINPSIFFYDTPILSFRMIIGTYLPAHVTRNKELINPE